MSEQNEQSVPHVHQEEHRDEPLVLEQLQQAKEYTEKTGNQSEVEVNKRQFVKEVPHAGREPRMAFTPERFTFRYGRFEGLTVGQLRELCLKAKGHPFAMKKAMEVEGMHDGVKCSLLHQDVRFLRQLGNE